MNAIKQYIVSHWRGEQSLPRSFWLNFVGATLLILLLASLLQQQGLYSVGVQRVQFPLGCVVATWSLGGAWHSARRRRGFWGGATAVVVGLNLVTLLLRAPTAVAALYFGVVSP